VTVAEMHHPFIVGERLYLRRVERADLGTDYFQWLNDPDVTRHMYNGTFPNSEEAMVAYYEQTVQSTDRVNLAMVRREDDRHIGNIGLSAIDWVNRTAEVGIIIGERSC
jgi:[ribosomal protein S5]-alanine N-acetyltransferase